jgi:hypothetical protein
MSRLRVLLLDDDDRQREAWSEELSETVGFRDHFEIHTVTASDFRASLGELEARRRDFRKAEAAIASEGDNPFDTADLLLVDFDLLKLSDSDRETGENVAYLVRVYSGCSVIVGLNQFGDNPFDLTLRAGNHSWADLNIGSGQLGNPELWSDSWRASADGDVFRPWSWPLLPQLVERFKARADLALKNLESPLLSLLEFPAEVVAGLPAAALDLLGSSSPPESVTLRQIAESPVFGLRRKDKVDDAGLARVCASRISKWLEGWLLTGQDVLVDAPHLVSRYPALLPQRSDPQSLETWNRTADLPIADLDRSLLEHFRFPRQDWLSREAWFGRRLAASETALQLYDKLTGDPPDFVFCEDRSSFAPSADVREFTADVPGSPYSRRFVLRGHDEVSYSPVVRFAV